MNARVFLLSFKVFRIFKWYDILNDTDEAEALSSLARSKMSSKARLDEKFEVLQRAEEAYYQNKHQKVGCITFPMVGYEFLTFWTFW